MKDCKDCQYRAWSNNLKDWCCYNHTIQRRHQYSPRCNIERKDGFCGGNGYFFKDKNEVVSQ